MMKVRKWLLLISMSMVLTVFMSTTCEKDDPDPNPGGCNAYVTATSTGAISASYCFEVLVSYNYTAGESLNLVTRQDGETIYGCTIQISSAFNGPGTYNCGFDDPAYIELILHGSDNEFYKAQSGTLTITQVDASHLTATFNVVTKGYYNQQSLNFTGTVNM